MYLQHERNIVHRDIKPENILLLDKDLTVKLADFGLAKIIGEDSFTTSLCGTPSCKSSSCQPLPLPPTNETSADVAPEILQSSKHRKYARPVDVWSLGVVLYICLCGFPPFSDELHTPQNPYSLSDQIKAARFDFPSPYWDSVGDPALELIEQMLVVDPTKRITIDKALRHPWITGEAWSPNDSCASLTETMETLAFSRKRVERERTLLSEVAGGKVGKRAPGTPGKGKAIAIASIPEEPKEDVERGRKGKPFSPQGKMAPGTNAFMHVGGKGGDETLYGSSYGGEAVSQVEEEAEGVPENELSIVVA